MQTSSIMAKPPSIFRIKDLCSELGPWREKGRIKDEKDKGRESGNRLAGSLALGLNQAAIFICGSGSFCKAQWLLPEFFF